MKVKDLIFEGNKVLHKAECKLLLADLLNKNPLELFNHLEDYVDKETYNKFLNLLNKLKDDYPIQYALGHINFYGNKFIVNENVLIPRFETEELVENTYNLINEYFNKDVSILDIGTGSGIIAITLNKLLHSKVLASDISESALKVAIKNNELNNTSVNFIKSDLFENINEKFDVIISNPPYINESDEVDESVFKYEPHLALYADNKGLKIYEDMFKDISKYLNEKYIIAIEHGNTQKEEIIQIINNYLTYDKLITKKDLQNRDRMIFIIKT